MKKHLIIFLLFGAIYSYAQGDKEFDLRKIILSKDSLLFNVGFNACDLRQFENLLSDRFEFFHDKDSVCYKKEFVAKLKSGLCGSIYQARREAVVGSIVVFPLYNKRHELYGAIQTGEHHFYEKTDNKNEAFRSSAKFTHVWILENGQWKLSRGLSYDHQPIKISADKFSSFNDDKEIEKWLVENKVPALGIGIIKGGQLQQVRIFGELRKGVSAPHNTLFNIASLTKPVTAIIALKLVSAGKWTLDEPIGRYWTDPDVANDPNSKKLTTRHILCHQTGFVNWRRATPDGKLHFDFTPGTKSQYSGEGFEYLRKALENKFHKSLNQLGEDLLFKPLQMTDTKYFWAPTTDSTRVAPRYNSEGVVYGNTKNTTANAAAGLLTTIEDYGKFLTSIMKSEGLTKSVFDDLVTNRQPLAIGKHIGLGFAVYDFGNGEFALSHKGGDRGCQTAFFIFPKSKQGLIIFTNADDGNKIYHKLYRSYLGEFSEKIIEMDKE